MASPRIIIVGGGITGLAAAHQLTALLPGAGIVVIERDPRLGGKILTERADGFLIEGGPDSFLATKPRGVGLCRELGIGDQLVGTNQATRGAFVFRKGALHPLPEGLTGLVPTRLGPMVRSRLFSPLGKARMALDFTLPARQDDSDETLAAFVSRRLGTEVYERLVEPLMAGIYAGDGRALSLAATFPQLRDAERRHGGLIRGVLAARRGAPASPTPLAGGAKPSPFLTPSGGLGALVDALIAHLTTAGVRIATGRAVTSIAPDANGGHLLIFGDGERLVADAVILATPAHATAALLVDWHPAVAATLRAIPHVSTATISLAYPVRDVPRPLAGHGYVIPRVENRPALACTWTSAKWHGRAPDGVALLRVFVGRAGQEDPLSRSDDALVELARTEIRDTLGIVAPPTLRRVHRWPLGMPQYTLGHLDRVAAIETALRAHPGLVVAGHSYRGVGIPDCIRSGEAAAEVVARISAPENDPGILRG